MEGLKGGERNVTQHQDREIQIFKTLKIKDKDKGWCFRNKINKRGSSMNSLDRSILLVKYEVRKINIMSRGTDKFQYYCTFKTKWGKFYSKFYQNFTQNFVTKIIEVMPQPHGISNYFPLI
jgi:hypothetical protein